MAKIEQIQLMIEELGAADGEIEGVLQYGDAEWAVIWADEVAVSLEADEDGRRLMLSANLGTPPDDRRAAVLETLMTYNLLWRDHGGVTAALGDGELFLLFGLPTDDLTTADLAATLANFAEKSRVWRSFATGGGESMVENPLNSAALRV